MAEIRLEDLLKRLDARNLNRGTQRGSALIKESIKRDGFARPVFAAADGTILGGNHAIKAVDELVADGADIAEPIVIHSSGDRPIIHVRDDIPTATDPKAVRLKIQDNRASQLNQDIDLLEMRRQMEEAEILPEDVGYEQVEIEVQQVDLNGGGGLGSSGDSAGVADRDRSIDPELDKTPATAPERVRLGDLWQIGDHLMLCGDCRDHIAVRRLIKDGERVELAITSPPYCSQRSYDESSSFKPIPTNEFVSWWTAVHINVRSVLSDGGSFVVNIKPHVEDKQRSLYVMKMVLDMVERHGWLYVDEFAWVRHSAPGRWPTRLRNDWESCFHLGNKESPKVRHANIAYPITDPHGRGAEADHLASHWNRPDESKLTIAYPGNVINAEVEGHGTGHVAVFPVALPSFFIKAFTDESQVVFDPFGGSGTTIIAANALGRRARVTEISPKHCDIILRRCEDRCGISPTLLDRVQ